MHEDDSSVTIKDEDKGNSSKSTTDKENDLTGYVQNYREDKHHDSFSFELQMENTAKRFICFSPGKRKLIQDKLLSPVKVKKPRKSQKNDSYFFDEVSELEDVTVGFQPLDYDNVTISKLKNVASMGLVDITLQIKQAPKRKKLTDGRIIDIYCVSDPTGSSKFTVWNESAGKVDVGSVYDLEGVRVQHDSFGQTELVTPKEGFKITKTSRHMETRDIDPALLGIKGEVISVQSIGKYRECDNCKKKLPDTTEKVVKCPNEKCPNDLVKLKFAGKGMYAKVTFFAQHDKQRHKLTMFHDVLESMVPGAWDLALEPLKKAIVSTDEIVIIKDNRNVVTDITIAE